ncbi:hypothetical protein J1789_20495 [Rahnella aceris]|nr:hypothetical protein [Rahnella aceris]MDP9705703.1 multidrug resistance efflux pump [Rahnella aquatilis]
MATLPCSAPRCQAISPTLNNATGNFTKISQRIAVRIELEPGQQQSNRLRPGMSTMVSVDTAQAPVSQQY